MDGGSIVPMSTASVVPTPGPVLVNPERRQIKSIGTPLPELSFTIHRITETHHGRTLLTLGHAAEYLADRRRFHFNAICQRADEEAIHILMDLSRRVFTEYAEQVTVRKRLEEKVIRWVTRWL
jgi:hypothetical protein